MSIASQPPVLAAVPDQTVNASDTLRVTLSATDSNGSAVVLTYRLGPDAPAGATLDPATGVLTWPTSRCSTASTNVFSVIVTDSLVPPLSATGFVRVVVVKSNAPPVLLPETTGVFDLDDLRLLTPLRPTLPPGS